MKSVLITFDQAYYERIMALLDRLGCRGFIAEALLSFQCQEPLDVFTDGDDNAQPLHPRHIERVS